MFPAGPDTTLTGMDISVHTQPSAHPVETGWVDDALASAYAAGEPLGALIGRPLAPGDGIMLVGWPETGPGRYHLIETRPGRSAGPATVPAGRGVLRSSQRGVGRRRAAGRGGPSGPGHRRHRRHRLGAAHARRGQRLPGGVLAESMDVFDAASQAIMSTELLPGEDPALLGGPDRISFYRLVHADLPITEGSRS